MRNRQKGREGGRPRERQGNREIDKEGKIWNQQEIHTSYLLFINLQSGIT